LATPSFTGRGHSSTKSQLTPYPAGIKHKVENKHQYQEYLDELKPLREELGVNLKEDLYPENSDSPYYNP
jgi:Cytochrome c oxidase subunit Va